MKKYVKKHRKVEWYYAVVRWEGYGVFTTWDKARVECDGLRSSKRVAKRELSERKMIFDIARNKDDF